MIEETHLAETLNKEIDGVINIFKICGASHEKCEEIKKYLLTCICDKLEELEEGANSVTPVDESSKDNNNEINQDSKIYQDNFINNIKGIRNPNGLMGSLLKLIKKKELTITQKSGGRLISLEGLKHDIYILNLGDIDAKKYNITKRRNTTDFSNNDRYETDKIGMEKISENFPQGTVASKRDIQNILNFLAKKYSLISSKHSYIHDEDIAFFMLITESYGDFLLKDSVLKCYDNFRGFKQTRNDGTGQIIILLKKQ